MYSDDVPDVVVPGDGPLTQSGHRCIHYAPSDDIAMQDVTNTLYACRNRTPHGVREHNWCYSCPAGFMVATLHLWDTAMERDRATILS